MYLSWIQNVICFDQSKTEFIAYNIVLRFSCKHAVLYDLLVGWGVWYLGL